MEAKVTPFALLGYGLFYIGLVLIWAATDIALVLMVLGLHFRMVADGR